jgi:hypothetical protein
VSGPDAIWELEFSHERRGLLARYEVAAPTAAAARALGRDALLAEHRPPSARRARSLFEQAQRAGGQPADGWVLHRIARRAEAAGPA